jgi:carboxymethylenebutenolidase
MTDHALPGGFPIYATGASESKRAVIVVQEAFGVNDHIRDVADRLSDEGYFAVAPQLFHRDGSPEVPYDDFKQAMPLMGNLTKDGITNDLNATTNFLATLGFGPTNIAVVGFCMGGTVAFYAATLGTVGAAASFYGGGLATGRFGFPPLVELAPELKSPWLGLYGDLDQSIPAEQVEELRAITDALTVTTEIVRYPDAEHGFHCDARPDAYNEAAALNAYERTLDFFAQHLTDK